MAALLSSQACYGILKVPTGSWLCRTCALGVQPKCLLCPKRGGALKPTRSGTKWVHVSCALWIPEVGRHGGGWRWGSAMGKWVCVGLGARGAEHLEGCSQEMGPQESSLGNTGGATPGEPGCGLGQNSGGGLQGEMGLWAPGGPSGGSESQMNVPQLTLEKSRLWVHPCLGSGSNQSQAALLK